MVVSFKMFVIVFKKLKLPLSVTSVPVEEYDYLFPS